MTDAAMADINGYVGNIRSRPYPYKVDMRCHDLADRIARGPVTLNEVINGPLLGLSDNHFAEMQFRFVQLKKFDAAENIAKLIKDDALREKTIKEIYRFKVWHEENAKT